MTNCQADFIFRLARKTLLDAGIEGGADEALLLFEHVAGLSRLDLLREPNQLLDPTAIDQLQALLAERIAGKPVGRIIGKREVFDLELSLNAATLEPRDDTGALIEAIMALPALNVQRAVPYSILDIGTGTGLIALSLLRFFENAVATGTDISADALYAAQMNAEKNRLDARFTPLLSDGFQSVSSTFDLIVSNPPYIRSDVIKDLSTEVREHDPLIALDGGLDGLDFYRMLAKRSRDYLKEGGLVAVEIGYDQKNDVIKLFRQHGWAMASEHKDLGGRDRALLFS